MNTSSKQVEIKVFRYAGNSHSQLDSFEIPVSRGMTVLDGLIHIKEHVDSSLAWRSSCRMGVCGSCGMLINGRAKLSCQTQLLELKTPVVVKPLSNFPVIRDLVPDLSGMFEKHRAVKPWIIRQDAEELDHPSGEFMQSPQEMQRYFQFSYCIKCGLCMSACPTLATDERYLGPQPLAQAYRYLHDSRDRGLAERTPSVFAKTGPWRCHFAGECSEVCPKHVDPALAIQLMKRESFLRVFHLRKSRPLAPVAPRITEKKPRPGIPAAPEKTVP